MEFVEVSKAKARMCAHSVKCTSCPLSNFKNGTGLNCETLINECPEKAEEIIMKWAEENPVKTNGSHFLEEFPKAWVSGRKYNSDNTMLVYVHLNLPGVFDDSLYFPAEWWDAEYKEVLKNADSN